MQILYTKDLKENIVKNCKEKIQNIDNKLKLVVINVGKDNASEIYVRNKRILCESLGISFSEIKYDENVSEDIIINQIKVLNDNKTVTGILIQLPLPKSINKYNVLNTINPKKDVDGLTSINLGNLMYNNRGIIPCTPKGIMSIFKYYNINLESKNVLLIGRSILVCKPLIHILMNENATVSVAHSKTNNLKELCKKSDIIVSAVGKPNFITKDMVNKDSIIIDVAINKNNNKTVGDADFEALKDYVKAITPVPGGVGVMTVVSLIENIIECYNLQK